MLNADDYRIAFEASPDAILVVARDGTIREANPQAVALFGYPLDELRGARVERLVPETARSRHEAHRAGFHEEPHARPMGLDMHLRARRKDGSEVPVEISLSPVRAGDADGYVIASVRDVGARLRLREYSTGALRATEDERHRIARELHDDTAQRLATLLVRVRLIGYITDEEERRTELDVLREQIRDAAEGVRRIARGLRPPALDELGLTAAVEAHLRDLREGANFDVHAELEAVDHLLDADARLVLYRIVQESLSNARRHSGVDHAYLRVVRDAGLVVATIEDHGRGFAPQEAAARGGGLGLVGMQERAVMADGRVIIHSAPGEGTRVRVELPGSVEETVDG